MFESREEAAKLLSQKLKKYKGNKQIVVLSLVRGGVVLGKIISDFLKCPMDILVIKKIGFPGNSEMALGAVAPQNTAYWNKFINFKINKTLLKKKRLEDLRQQEKELRGSKKALDINNKSVILVDDGIATGATVLAALRYLKKTRAKKIILATPIIAKDTLLLLKRYFDVVVALEIKQEFYAVGEFYRYFPQVENDEVKNLLK